MADAARSCFILETLAKNVDQSPKPKNIPVKRLELWTEANVRNENPARNIEDLASSIRKNGMRVPLLVKKEKDSYKVFSGQRRLLAAQIAQIKEAPCYVYERISRRDAIMLSLTENVLREAMTKDDKSAAAVELLKICKSIERVAKIMGVSTVTIRRYLKYNDIPEKLRNFKDAGLSGNEINSIFVKFPDVKEAAEVAKDLASIRGRIKRSAYRTAIRTSRPSASTSDLRKAASRIEHAKPITILLDDDYYRTLSKAALVRSTPTEEFTTGIVEEWIEGYKHGEHRN